MKDSMSDVELKDKIHTTPNAKYVAIHLSINLDGTLWISVRYLLLNI